MEQIEFDVKEIQEAFSLPGQFLGSAPCTGGHINNTFMLRFQAADGSEEKYLLQLINTHVFQQPELLMENIVRVTEYLRTIIARQGGDPQRETLRVFFTKDKRPYFLDDAGNHWRCYNYITDSYTLQSIEHPQDFESAARAFGRFQNLLADYPSATLHETIPDFHNTVCRYQAFSQAVEENLVGRAGEVSAEIDFVRKREKDTAVLVDLLQAGELPLRVTHNDTKLNNVMFDKATHEGICVIDLDTVMPGLSLYDFGDSIRFGANTAAEDEKDLSRVSLSLELYEAYTRGYLSAAGGSLTPAEIAYLPFSAKLMTLECGMRFLTDYLQGDTYFKTAYATHNLVRCRTQFALVADMEKKMTEMQKITQRLAANIA